MLPPLSTENKEEEKKKTENDNLAWLRAMHANLRACAAESHLDGANQNKEKEKNKNKKK